MKLDVALASPAAGLRGIGPWARSVAGAWPDRAFTARTAAARWLGDRSVRERWLLGILALVLVAAGLDRLIWHPLLVARQEALIEIARDDRIAAQLRVVGPDVARIAAARIGSLSAIVTARATRAGLAIARIEPQGDTVTVSLDGVAFDTLVDWLAALDHDAGVGIVDLKVDRRPDPGIVSAQVTLTER